VIPFLKHEKGCIIPIRDREHSRRVQEYLFSLGYKWMNGKIVQYEDRMKFLYVLKLCSFLSFGITLTSHEESIYHYLNLSFLKEERE